MNTEISIGDKKRNLNLPFFISIVIGNKNINNDIQTTMYSNTLSVFAPVAICLCVISYVTSGYPRFHHDYYLSKAYLSETESDNVRKLIELNEDIPEPCRTDKCRGNYTNFARKGLLLWPDIQVGMEIQMRCPFSFNNPVYVSRECIAVNESHVNWTDPDVNMVCPDPPLAQLLQQLKLESILGTKASTYQYQMTVLRRLKYCFEQYRDTPISETDVLNELKYLFKMADILIDSTSCVSEQVVQDTLYLMNVLMDSDLITKLNTTFFKINPYRDRFRSILTTLPLKWIPTDDYSVILSHISLFSLHMTTEPNQMLNITGIINQDQKCSHRVTLVINDLVIDKPIRIGVVTVNKGYIFQPSYRWEIPEIIRNPDGSISTSSPTPKPRLVRSIIRSNHSSNTSFGGLFTVMPSKPLLPILRSNHSSNTSVGGPFTVTPSKQLLPILRSNHSSNTTVGGPFTVTPSKPLLPILRSNHSSNTTVGGPLTVTPSKPLGFTPAYIANTSRRIDMYTTTAKSHTLTNNRSYPNGNNKQIRHNSSLAAIGVAGFTTTTSNLGTVSKNRSYLGINGHPKHVVLNSSIIVTTTTLKSSVKMVNITDMIVMNKLMILSTRSELSQDVHDRIKVVYEYNSCPEYLYCKRARPPECVKSTRQSDYKFWRATGCKTSRGQCGSCHCTGLGAYAVFTHVPPSPGAPMILPGTKDSDLAVFLGFPYNKELEIAGLCLSAVSLTCLIVTVTSYAVFRNTRRGTPTTILVNLCIAMIALYIMLLTVPTVGTLDVNTCIVTNVFRYYLVFVTLLWNGVEAVNMYLMLVKVFESHISKFTLKTGVLAWGVPALMVGIILSVNRKSFNGQYVIKEKDICIFKCQLRNSTLYYGYLTPMCVIIFHNLIVFGLVLKVLTKQSNSMGKSQKRSRMIQLVGGIATLVLLGVPWIFSSFGAIDGTKSDRLAMMEGVFQVIFVVFVNLQGLFIFIFHCARNNQIRQSWRSVVSTARQSLTVQSFRSQSSQEDMVDYKSDGQEPGVSNTSGFFNDGADLKSD